MDSYDPPNIFSKTDNQDTTYMQPSAQGCSNPTTPYSNAHPPCSCYAHAQTTHLPAPLTPYDPATSFNQWFLVADLHLANYPETIKMKALLSALPKDIRSWLQLKGISETSDYDYGKPTILSLMSVTEEPREMSDFFERERQPGESYAQFAMALQAILVEATGNRFSPADQEYLVSSCFIARAKPHSLKTQLRPLKHAGIVELIRAATNLSSIRDNPNHQETRPPPTNPTQPNFYPHRQHRPARAIQASKYESVRLYTLKSGNCPVLKVTVGSRAHKFLIDTGSAISIVKPGTVPVRLRKQIDQKHTVVMEAANGSTFKSEGSFNLQFKLGNQQFRHRVYLSSVINGPGLLGMDFLGKHQSRILLDKGKLILDGIVELTLGRERPSLGSRAVNTRESKTRKTIRAEKLLDELGEPPEVIKSFLIDNEDIFALEGEPTGRSNIIKHVIDTGDAKPIAQRPRRTPAQYQEFVREEIANLLKNKVIRPSSSAWAAPIVVTKKKNGSLRLCMDYRKLNAVTKRDQYPMPRIDDGFDYLSGSQYFSTLDLRSGYWQVEVDPKSREKTAFVVPTGLYEFETMPFGLMNAPASFQRLMHQVLRDLTPKQCQVYLDDVIVFSHTITDHIARLKAIFTRLREAGLKLNPKKCKFLQTAVTYLGHTISKEGVHTDPGKTSKIHEWPLPRNAEEVRRFLGLAGYYRRFVKGFADIAKPLTTAYHPEGNGQVERTNRTLKSLLRMQLECFEQDQWDLALPTCLLAYRAAVHASTGQTPAFLTYGRELRLAADITNEPPHALHAVGRPCFATQTREALYEAHEVARRRLGLAHKHQKDYYDKTAHGLPYQAGDLVMYKTMPPLSANNKFYRPWDGPFIISSILNDASCRITRVGENRDKGFIAHFNRLKPCVAHQSAGIEELEYATPPPVDNEIEITTRRRKSPNSECATIDIKSMITEFVEEHFNSWTKINQGNRSLTPMRELISEPLTLPTKANNEVL
ncbi:unnamed protein product [Hymenolepis diminuta]|uniref:Reverse transcriptase n=1 Tax=Hymenolepis diminuta TaxID=6216 RepID=A0A564ZAF4_HYMDI|nr:unnamed protein product [Hymenolepis diminuta]